MNYWSMAKYFAKATDGRRGSRGPCGRLSWLPHRLFVEPMFWKWLHFSIIHDALHNRELIVC